MKSKAAMWKKIGWVVRLVTYLISFKVLSFAVFQKLKAAVVHPIYLYLLYIELYKINVSLIWPSINQVYKMAPGIWDSEQIRKYSQPKVRPWRLRRCLDSVVSYKLSPVKLQIPRCSSTVNKSQSSILQLITADEEEKKVTSWHLKKKRSSFLSPYGPCAALLVSRLFGWETSLTVTLPRACRALISPVVTEAERQKSVKNSRHSHPPLLSSSALLLLPPNVGLALVRAAVCCRVHS